jgi:hypothetical protein
MTNTRKRDPRPLFTPSTLPQPGAPDPVVTFIEGALLAIANRRDEPEIPEPEVAKPEIPEPEMPVPEIPEPAA